jgi:hypothetical protein
MVAKKRYGFRHSSQEELKRQGPIEAAMHFKNDLVLIGHGFWDDPERSSSRSAVHSPVDIFRDSRRDLFVMRRERFSDGHCFQIEEGELYAITPELAEILVETAWAALF